MGELLRTWWPVMLLLWLPSLAQASVAVWINRAFRKLDESHPDDLPYTAGEWLGKEIHRLGLASKLSAIVTDDTATASIDGYHPTQNVIQLRADTYFKRDPMHWAIAAHELGHARFKLGMPLLGRFILAMVYVKSAFIAVAMALTVGNVLFALPNLTHLALVLWQSALVLQILVLLDESVASTLAIRSLRMWPEIQDKQMRSGRRALRLAFATYLVHFATRALMLTQWHLVVEHTRVPMVPPTYTLTTFGTLLAGVATFIAVMYALDRFFAVFRKPRAETKQEILRTAVWQLALLLLLYLVWNHRADTTWAYYVIAAMLPVAGWIAAVLAVPGAILHGLIFARIKRSLDLDPTHRTPELARDHAEGKVMRSAGNLMFDRLVERTVAESVIVIRVRLLMRLTYVPLLVLFWLA